MHPPAAHCTAPCSACNASSCSLPLHKVLCSMQAPSALSPALPCSFSPLLYGADSSENLSTRVKPFLVQQGLNSLLHRCEARPGHAALRAGGLHRFQQHQTVPW